MLLSQNHFWNVVLTDKLVIVEGLHSVQARSCCSQGLPPLYTFLKQCLYLMNMIKPINQTTVHKYLRAVPGAYRTGFWREYVLPMSSSTFRL